MDLEGREGSGLRYVVGHDDAMLVRVFVRAGCTLGTCRWTLFLLASIWL